MRTFHIKLKGTPRESIIVCRKNVLSKALPELLPRLKAGGAIVFTDSNVYALYQRQIDALTLPVFVMPAGEEHKDQTTLFALLQAMAEANLRRTSTLIALGGGVVGDVGGLAASLYMRGISCIQVPTTLLAQVDSSVGGKTAIDFCGVKNLIGAFHQPSLVLADPTFFGTLPPREIRCGLGEIVKHGALNAALFDKLSAQDDLSDLDFLASVVPENIRIKAEIVQKDPNERGLRRCLNLGHTTGHAIELAEKTLSHGECVLLGLLYESRIAERHLDADVGYLQALSALIKRVLADPQTDAASHARLALLDKKNTAKDKVTLAVPVKRGEFALLELGFREYEEELKEIGQTL